MTHTPTGPDPQASLPLAGMRIVELSSYVATPFCGLVLRQLGAEVVRVEQLGGAPDRTRMPRAKNGTSLYWLGLNGGKRDLAVDLASDSGREIVADLIAESTIVVSNTDRHPGLSHAELSERVPGLISVLLTGTRRGGNGVDYTVQASTGFPLVSGPENAAGPTNATVPAWDLAAGLYLATGLLAAVHERDRTGKGQQVRLGLEDVALATGGMLGMLTEAQLNPNPRGAGGNYVYGSFGRDFLAGDGTRFMLVVLTASHWRKLVAATGLAEIVAGIERGLGEDLADEAARYRNRAVLAGLLERWFAERTWDEIEPVLAATRVLVERYRSFDDLAANGAEALREYALFERLEHPELGSWYAPGSPLLMGDRAAGPALAPVVGQDTDAVLAELGWSAARIAEARDRGVVA